MGYLNENGLARYDDLIKNWVTLKSGTVDGISPLLNWQKTEIDSSVTFYPLPAAPIDPVVNFAFIETGPAEGEKSSTNPSTITGVSTITVIRCETVGVDETSYTVDLGGTYYGGSLDVSTGVLTATWWGHVFDGTETPINFTAFTNNCRCGFFPYVLQAKNSTNQICTHLPFLASYTDDSAHFYINWQGANTGLVLFAPYLTQSSFMSWLADEYVAGTPVTIVCELKTPQTVQLTPTQIYSFSQIDPYTPRLNTIYSDQASVQVGYPKSPLATSTELTNAIISLGGNV